MKDKLKFHLLLHILMLSFILFDTMIHIDFYKYYILTLAYIFAELLYYIVLSNHYNYRNMMYFINYSIVSMIILIYDPLCQCSYQLESPHDSYIIVYTIYRILYPSINPYDITNIVNNAHHNAYIILTNSYYRCSDASM